MASDFNRTPPLAGANAWRRDPLLVQLTDAFTADVRDGLDSLGAYVLAPEALDLARLANQKSPTLEIHDRHGERLDRLEFHPAYHALMRRSVAEGLHGSFWEEGANEAGHRATARAARFYLMAQLECGHLCPITMTNASLASIASSESLFNDWRPRVVTRKYDPSERPPSRKAGLTLGMGMTERQGGTDLRTNRTEAAEIGSGYWRIEGEKWFFSAPMSDGFLVLAQTGEGPGCFLIQRIRGDGQNNGLRFQRLKDKLGNRSNASSEVRFEGTIGQLLGEPGKGIRTIMDMVSLTRLDCALASSGLMRVALAEAVHHCRHREVFGAKLYDQPLMKRVLADMALDVAAATALAFRLARAFDEAAESDIQASWLRLMTPVVKYWICKIAPALTYEAMECLGGDGYCETFPMARFYREAPVNAIWEGSGNVMALDLLRALNRSPKALETILQDLHEGLGRSADSTVDVLRAAAEVARNDEGSARFLTEQLALAAAAAELRRLGAGRIADAFAESRLGGAWRSTYGTLDSRYEPAAILETLYPADA
ncbi:acyl-CoA dehydrogenase family protein [Notoacmeibacter sp. MSK16QG-6]|uniref:acyl-CoA dehydrogenase family protein n=1 Tax=Notoacmeibacter sp. MSK16QG-6 TaxID=2957982 RepID=UPI00209E124D|nr:acyl-CoA dehydrogenase family protein [Notoacmeibacter sp. MSK16QG-6]MCP1197883.1 acyl-CoA dehydrogenase family protein [Notoacmeibacter sp. MSK16QG-6]